MKKIYMFRDGRVRAVKPDADLNTYVVRNPGAFRVHPPSVRTMERWISDGVAKALDGCRVEPDGRCEHGHPSWLLAMGCI